MRILNKMKIQYEEHRENLSLDVFDEVDFAGEKLIYSSQKNNILSFKIHKAYLFFWL